MGCDQPGLRKFRFNRLETINMNSSAPSLGNYVLLHGSEFRHCPQLFSMNKSSKNMGCKSTRSVSALELEMPMLGFLAGGHMRETDDPFHLKSKA